MTPVRHSPLTQKASAEVRRFCAILSVGLWGPYLSIPFEVWARIAFAPGRISGRSPFWFPRSTALLWAGKMTNDILIDFESGPKKDLALA